MKITHLSNNKEYIKQCSNLILNNFNTIIDIDTAVNIVQKSLNDTKINLIALDEKNEVIGWICGIENYNLHIWEIQPLVIRSDYQHKRLGSLLLSEFEKEVF